MCVLSIKVAIQKKSWNLFNDPCNSTSYDDFKSNFQIEPTENVYNVLGFYLLQKLFKIKQ